MIIRCADHLSHYGYFPQQNHGYFSELDHLCGSNQGLSELDVKIKWPNDLYLKGLKVGGILCTSSYQPKVYNICTGEYYF